MRIVPLLLAAVLAAFPVMPAPGTCALRMSSMPMHHPCCAATSRAPVKRAVIRVDVDAPPKSCDKAEAAKCTKDPKTCNKTKDHSCKHAEGQEHACSKTCKKS